MVTPLTIGDIFGIFFIVLIIQFALDIFPQEEEKLKRTLLRYAGVLCISASLSAIVWVSIAILIDNVPWIINDFLVPKPLLFYITIIALFVFGVLIYWYIIKTKK
jgi:hypothetical protein